MTGDIKLTGDVPPYPSACLGEYLVSWEQLETLQRRLLQWLMDVKTPIVSVMVASPGINQRTIRELLESFAVLRLNEADLKKFSNYCDSMKSASTHRNKIVHGVWQLQIESKNGTNIPKDWVRFFPPTDPRDYDKMYSKPVDQKVRARHCYPPTRIQSLAKELIDLRNAIAKWADGTTLLEIGEPKPLAL